MTDSPEKALDYRPVDRVIADTAGRVRQALGRPVLGFPVVVDPTLAPNEIRLVGATTASIFIDTSDGPDDH